MTKFKFGGSGATIGTITGLNNQILGTGGTSTQTGAAITSVAAGAAAGTSPTVTLTANSNDTSGQISILLGSIPTTGILSLLCFSAGKFTTFPQLTPGNAAACAAMSSTTWPYVSPVGFLIVIGTNSPSVDGIYLPSVLYNGQLVYSCAATGYSFWFNGTDWVCSTVAGTNGTNYWTSSTSTITSSYTAGGSATGAPSVAFGSGVGGFTINTGRSALSAGTYLLNYLA